MKKAEIIPVIAGAAGMIKKTITENLNITTNELQVEAVRQRFSEDFKKSPWNEAMTTKFHIWFMNHDSLPKRKWTF